MGVAARVTRGRWRAVVGRITAAAGARDWRVLMTGGAPGPVDASSSPANYEAWLRRQPPDQAGFPQDWTERADLSMGSDPRVAAVVHVYYPELLDELIGHLGAIPVAFDLFVTNASGSELSLEPGRMPQVRHVVILDVENRGRDLWPLAQVVNVGSLDRHDLVIKVHTKQSDWRDAHAHLGGTGRAWRCGLLSALLGDPDNVHTILDAFATSPGLGMVTADGSVLGPEFWGRNEPVAATLLRRLELGLRSDDLAFAAGSMYWSRARILRRLKGLHLSAADFEDERGQVDGTTAHALERVIGLLAARDGYQIVERSRLSGSEGRERG